MLILPPSASIFISFELHRLPQTLTRSTTNPMKTVSVQKLVSTHAPLFRYSRRVYRNMPQKSLLFISWPIGPSQDTRVAPRFSASSSRWIKIHRINFVSHASSFSPKTAALSLSLSPPRHLLRRKPSSTTVNRANHSPPATISPLIRMATFDNIPEVTPSLFVLLPHSRFVFLPFSQHRFTVHVLRVLGCHVFILDFILNFPDLLSRRSRINS